MAKTVKPRKRVKAQPKLLVLDVDGILTDGGIYVDDEGREFKRFSAADGHGLKMLMREGVEVALLSGRASQAVFHRAKDLGIKYVILGEKIKMPAFRSLIEKVKVTPAECAYLGDDLVDLPLMRKVGWSAAPADARPEVKAQADYVSKALGGHGAVRDVCERILVDLGLWEHALARYMPGGEAEGDPQ